MPQMEAHELELATRSINRVIEKYLATPEGESEIFAVSKMMATIKEEQERENPKAMELVRQRQENPDMSSKEVLEREKVPASFALGNILIALHMRK